MSDKKEQTTLDLPDDAPLDSVEQYRFKHEPIKGQPELRWTGKRPFTGTQYSYSDFLIQTADGRGVIVAIKGVHEIDDSVVQAKAESVRQLADPAISVTVWSRVPW